MLRMSAASSLDQFKQTLSNRWQMPLLGVSLALLVVAVLRVMPPEPAPSFQQRLDQVAALQRGGFLTEAAETIRGLLEQDGLANEERGALFRAMAETLYLSERPRQRHEPNNVERIIVNHRQSLALGLPATPAVHEQVGAAYRWLDAPDKAIAQFRKAIEGGGERSSRLRREIIELLQEGRDPSLEHIEEDLAGILDDERADPNDLLWAVEQRVDSLSARDRLGEVGELLDQVEPRLARAGLGPEVQYLRAWLGHLTGEADQAERILLDLRNKLAGHEELAVKVGWLLGRVHLGDGRPQEALAVFQEVSRFQPSGEYFLASRLGIAECLAALYHIDEAADVYEEVAGVAARYASGRVVDRDAIRASLTSLYAVLRKEGRLEAALRFLRLAAALAPPGKEEVQARNLRDLAELYAAIGEARLAQAKAVGQRSNAPATTTAPATSGGRDDALSSAREAFQEAAEAYLRLSCMETMTPARSAEAAWLAARHFDKANLPSRLIAALEDFLVAYPESARLPEVLYALGEASQSEGRYRQAIDRYAQNQRRFPRTPAAMRSLVPMAQCFMALGPASYPQAEKALLTIVEQPTVSGRYDPVALEYREALFVLGDLYGRWGKPARAISRLEEFLERYPRDTRVTRTQFVLANGYRKSGLVLLAARGAAAGANVGDAERSGHARLGRAESLFSEVIRTLEGRPYNALQPIEQRYLKYSYLYRGDCAFDLGGYPRALALYQEAARRFRQDPVCLSAYVQILNCHQRLGRDAEARATVERVRWLLKSIPADRFEGTSGGQDAAGWGRFFDWLEESGLFKSVTG